MPRLLFFPHRAPALVALMKAYIHGHYRLSPKTHMRVWVDSYTDKRPERGRTTFADWAARKAHFEHHLGHGRQREALHAFHDLEHDEAHQLAGELGLHAGEQHASKKDLMEAVHGKLADKRQALQNALVAGERAKWAEKKAAGTVGNKPVKVIRLTGDEFGAGLAGKSLRDAAVSYAKKHFVDAAFENASTGQSIEVTWQSVKHALANANDAEMRVFHALPRILKTARYVESVPDKLGRPDIQAVHRYAVKVLLKDEPLTIGVIVRETKDGHRFYDHFIIKSKNPAGISEAAPPAGVLGDQPTAGLAGNSVDPQTSDDKGDKSHKGNDDGPDSASQTSAIRGTGAQTRGEDSARQPDHWDAVAGQYSAGAVAALRKRAADNAWSPEFVAALSETLGTLPPELCAFFDYRVDIGSDVAIVHRVNLDNVPEHMRASYAQAGAMTVNGMRIEFIQDRQPTTNTLRHELVHLAWQELYGTDRRDGMARKVVDQVLERIAGDGERMLKWATSRSEKDVFQQLEANQIKKMLRRIKKYGKEGKHLPSTLKGMLELDLMIGSGYMDAAKGAGLSITPEGQYSAVALYMAMAKRHGVTLDREFAQEEGVAYLCGEDEAAARQVFGAMAEGMEREVVRRNMPTLASVAPEQSSWHYKIAKLQRGLNFISDPEGSKAKQQEIDEITRGPLHEGFRAYNEVMRDYASQHPGWFNFDDHGNAWLRESKMIEKSMRHTPMLLFFPNPAHAALVKAYIHGHYRINQKTGAKVWVDSYTDKRQTKAGQMEFAHWNHRKEHVRQNLAHGHTTEALQAFHDLSHGDAHQLASDLGLHDGSVFHANKKALMTHLHANITRQQEELKAKVQAQEEAKAGQAEQKAVPKASRKKKATDKESASVREPAPDPRALLAEAVDHLEADAKQSDLPPKEQAEDQALVDRLKTGLAPDPDDQVLDIAGEDVPFAWKLVEADDLAPTEKTADNQLRDRTRAASAEQVAAMAGNLKFRLLAESPLMDYGAPVLAKDGKTIIGGNGRTLAIRRAYSNGNADQYKADLARKAARFGLDTGAVSKLKSPVLVRVLAKDVDVKQAAIASNEGGGARMSGLEQARVDGERLGDLADLAITDDGDLTTAANRPFIRRFLAAVPVAQRPAFQAADGDLSQEGITRLRNAVLYRAYGDSDTLARMVESSDPGQRNVLAALVKLAPTVAQARDDAQAGRLHDLDVAADIVAATATLAKVRADKTFGSVDEYLRQGGLFGDAISPEASLILRHFDSNLRSAKAISAFLLDYYEAVRAAGDPNQGSLFGDPPPDKATLLRQTHERHQKDRQAPAQDDLFKARGQSADRPDPAGRARSARDGGVVGGGQARPALGRGPRYLFFKAIQPGTKGRITDLFAQEVQHRGYTDTHGHYHAPHQQRHHVKGPDADAADPEPAPDPALTALLKQYAGDAEVTPAELAEAVRQYRAVEAKYRGTPGWLKAPNGQPTRLNERQWVLARTPNFKRWFGNWQFDPASPVTVVPVRGDEIPVALDDSAALRKWLLSSPDFKTATVNRSNDVPIGFSTRGLKDSLKRKGEAQRSAYAVLRSLVETAHAVDYAPSDRAEIAGQDIYVGALTLGGRLYAVRIKADVRHDRSTAYKDHKAALVEHLADIEITPAVNKGGTDGALGYPAATGPTRSGVTVSLGDLLGPDKPAASQVRDPNGEPLVVYHGTGVDVPRMRKPDSFPPMDTDGPSPFYVPPWDDTQGPFYFTSAPASASEYADASRRVHPATAQPNVLSAFLLARAPVTVDAKGQGWVAVNNQAIDEVERQHADSAIIRNVKDHANPDDKSLVTVTMVFDPTQVKSAIGNTGTFRPDLDHLNKAAPRALFFRALRP